MPEETKLPGDPSYFKIPSGSPPPPMRPRILGERPDVIRKASGKYTKKG